MTREYPIKAGAFIAKVSVTERPDRISVRIEVASEGADRDWVAAADAIGRVLAPYLSDTRPIEVADDSGIALIAGAGGRIGYGLAH